MKISLITYNIHKGFRMGGKRFVLHEIRELLRSTKVDMLFLQEVVGENQKKATLVKRWPKESQYEFLADEVWESYQYGQNACFPSRDHGNALLSRFPITEWENLNISTNRFEHRGALHTKIEIPGSQLDLRACCTHLDLSRPGQIKQLKKISAWLNTEVPPASPLILAGDFNDPKDRASATLLKTLGLHEAVKISSGRLQPTFPSVFPLLRLDRIYTRGLKVVEATVLREKVWRKMSDHLPVHAILSLGE